MSKQIIFVSYKELEIDEYNVRRIHISDPELESSIEAQGIIEPLVVRKVKGKKKYQVVCGGRRMMAAQSLKLKEVPVIVRDIDDITAIGLSLQENLARENLGSIETAEAIAKMYSMLNGGRTQKEKVEEIGKVFGMKKTRVYSNLQISSLSEALKKQLLPTVGNSEDTDKKEIDTVSLAKVASRDWDEQKKSEAIEELSDMPSRKDRLKALQKMEELQNTHSPREAVEEMKREPAGGTYKVYIPYKLNTRFSTWCVKHNKPYTEAIQEAVENYMKRRR